MTLVSEILSTNITQGGGIDTSKSNLVDAVKFRQSMAVEFNKLSNMKQEEILNYVYSIQNDAISGRQVDRVLLSSAATELRNSVRKYEKTVANSISGKASIQDVMLAANDATQTVKVFTMIRTKFLEALDKIFSMQL